MKAPARLGIYGLILITVFAGAFFTAGALVPDHVVENWSTNAEHEADQTAEHDAGDATEHDTGDEQEDAEHDR
ncbi:MAG TPA: hypothetical protein H9871_11940 [Candidatus Nesterenkonia stercoripullorum]|uniref:Uncharacterized protein n=1 Tax=Candidatus Nesterenkonia stercoripullorum TaxID=2838701 RepID=A0A9D1UUT4_9MICC|nr:hypothetical protein [Candidatus Nesterenkonia stercoripullorum]